jgi:hypothetical protein
MIIIIHDQYHGDLQTFIDFQILAGITAIADFLVQTHKGGWAIGKIEIGPRAARQFEGGSGHQGRRLAAPPACANDHMVREGKVFRRKFYESLKAVKGLTHITMIDFL